jgi:hypothetical protein
MMKYVDNYISAELIETAVDQTNLCAQQIATVPRPAAKHSGSEQWKPVTVCETKKFLTGIIRKPTLEWYRSTRDILLTTMSRNRFQIIHRYLHFNNTAIETSEDRLYKILPILDTVFSNFKSNYIPDREISFDEGILIWRGHLRFRVYNPGKITKYGILVRIVCESKSGYICNMHIYDGKCGPLTETVSLLEP